MTDIKYLQNLAIQVDIILKEELRNAGLEIDVAEARIYDLRTVGIQGDQRTYAYPAEINLNGKETWPKDFLDKLSSRITNEVKDVNRVVYVLATEEDKK